VKFRTATKSIDESRRIMLGEGDDYVEVGEDGGDVTSSSSSSVARAGEDERISLLSCNS
jgi:hypothetical protein